MKCVKQYILCLLTGMLGLQTIAKACTDPVLSTTVTNVLCYGGTTGSVSLSVSGGNSPFTYSWTGTGGYTASSQNISGIPAGTYSVTVSGGGCSSVANVTVTQPAALTASITSGVACTGQSFSPTAVVTGGTSPYSYTWTGPNSFSSTTRSDTITNATYGNGGMYAVNVTDANGCTKAASSSITVYATPNLSLYATYLSCHGVYDGSVSLSVGGATTYTYLWTGPNSFTSTGQNISSLQAGLYSVTVTANTGCTASGHSTVLEPAAVTSGATSNSPVCTGDILELFGFGSGGTGTLIYSWTGPGGYTSSVTSPIMSPSIVSESGTYVFTVTDAHQCTATSSTVVSVSNGPTVVTNITSPTCNGTSTGAINLAITGNTAPYTCSWIGSNNYAATTQNISGIPAGTYNVDISIAGGCIKHLSNTVTQPAQLQTYASSNLPVCNGGPLLLAGLANGGTGILSYSWTGLNSFTSQVSHPTISSIGSNGTGTYVMTVKDANNCTALYNVPIVVDTTPVLSVTATSVSCHTSDTGAVQLTVSGGSSFSFAWTGPGSYSASSQNITNLNGGTYSVAVTSSAGCVATATATVNAPPDISPVIFTDTPLCAGGILHLNVAATGGTGALTYNWSGPNSFAAAQQNATSYFVTLQDSGVYTLTINDANHCTKITSIPVRIVAAPVISATPVGVSCFGDADGTIALNIAGGVSPFNYQWTGPGTFSATTGTITNLLPGAYYVSVTGGCQATYLDTFVVQQPSKLTDSLNVPNVCAGDTLRFTDVISGGTLPYSYSWSGPAGFSANTANAARANATSVNTGIYSLTVHDANNCVVTANHAVTVYPLPVVNAGSDTTICLGNSIVLNAGNPGDTYLWSTGDTTGSIRVGTTGTYSVAVVDGHGCIGKDTLVLQVDATPHIDAIQAVPSGSVFSFSAIGPHFVTGYYWSFGDGSTSNIDSPVHNYTSKGIYTIRLAGVNLCGSDTIMTTVQVDTLTGVAMTAGINETLQIFPDPARDHITVRVTNMKMMRLRMVNMEGVTVFEQQATFNGSYHINTSSFASGIYFMYVDTDAGITVRKVSILR